MFFNGYMCFILIINYSIVHWQPAALHSQHDQCGAGFMKPPFPCGTPVKHSDGCSSAQGSHSHRKVKRWGKSLLQHLSKPEVQSASQSKRRSSNWIEKYNHTHSHARSYSWGRVWEDVQLTRCCLIMVFVDFRKDSVFVCVSIVCVLTIN